MAKTSTKKTVTERPDRLIAKIVRSTNARSKKDIQQWRTALQQAENADSPKRILLYNIYNEILLDAHLSAEIERRLNALLGTNFELYDADGTAQPEASALLQKNWFKQLMRYAWEKILWGHSLIEIEGITSDGFIDSIRLVNRWHVYPEKGIVAVKQGDDGGILFRTNEKYAPWLFEFGDIYDLGLLNKCVPHVIYKRFAQAAYSEYCEVLGIPPRVLITDALDTEHLNRSEDMLANMGTNTYAVIGKNEEIKFVDAKGGDGEIFTNLFTVSANELSKLIGGSVIGGDSQNGSRAKEQVGLDLSKSIQKADRAMISTFINEQVLPRLIDMGYPFDGMVFEFDQEKDINQELTNALKIAAQFELDPKGIDYMNQTFGVPVLRQLNNQAAQDGSVTAKTKNDFFR